MSQQEDEVRPLCVISTRSLLFCCSELLVCQIDSAQNCFTHGRKLPRCINQKSVTLSRSFAKGKKKKSSFIGLIFLSYPPPHLNPVSFTGGNTVLESEFRLSQVNRATGPGGDLKKKNPI